MRGVASHESVKLLFTIFWPKKSGDGTPIEPLPSKVAAFAAAVVVVRVGLLMVSLVAVAGVATVVKLVIVVVPGCWTFENVN